MFLINEAPAAANVGGTGTSMDIFPLSSNSSKACILTVPASAKLEGRKWRASAQGVVTVAGTSPTVTLSIQSGTSLTSGSNTTVAASSAISLTTSASYPWLIEIECVGSTLSGTLSGYVRSEVGSAVPVVAALASVLSGLVFTPSVGRDNIINMADPAISLVIGVTFGVSNASNLATMYQFTLEA